MQWYIFAGSQLHWDYSSIEKISLDEFLDIILLYDKMMNSKDYIPAENIFRQL